MSTRRITSFAKTADPASTKDAPSRADIARGIAEPQPKTSAIAQPAPSTPSVDEIDADERALRQFDLDSKFGPTSGLSRLQRWERASALGLQPPESVRALIMKHGEDSDLNRHLFTEGKV